LIPGGCTVQRVYTHMLKVEAVLPVVLTLELLTLLTLLTELLPLELWAAIPAGGVGGRAM
jgi:hypothetical protein